MKLGITITCIAVCMLLSASGEASRNTDIPIPLLDSEMTEIYGLGGGCPSHKVNSGPSCASSSDGCSGSCFLSSNCASDTWKQECEDVAETCETGLPDKCCTHFNQGCSNTTNGGGCKCGGWLGQTCKMKEAETQNCSSGNESTAENGC